MARMRMLFVDDRSKRLHAALSNYSDKYTVVLATNVREALRQMSADFFDVISLDHDLNGCDFEDPDSTGCGMEIVRYIGKTGWPERMRRPEFWIHSKNLFAANLMVISLKNMGFTALYKPFQYDKVEHIKYDANGIPEP